MGSTAGNATPAFAAKAPINNKAAKDSGAAQMRLLVIALHMPTANIAARWSRPVNGWVNPVKKPW